MARPVRTASFAAGALGLAVGLVLLGGVALGGGEPDPGPDAGRAPAAALPDDPRDRAVAELRQRLEQVPGDWTAWAALGSAYVEQARLTGDPSGYPRAQEALEESLRVRPEDNAAALTGLGALAAARHDFTAAVDRAREAIAVNAFDATAYGVLTDGLVELGRYEEADTALQRMADISPDFSAATRISYLRELYGDVAGARQAMEQARDLAFSPADVAFASYYLGELAFNAGDLTAAQAHYDEGLARDPSYLPLVAGTAKVAGARGETDAAVADYRRVVDALPLPGYAAELGDLLAATGRDDEAAEQYALVRAETRLIEANGGSADLEAALFAADHGEPAEALELARREHEARRSVFVEDALAWALHVNGQDAEALPLAQSALRLGTRNASLHYHLGMIQSALGQAEQARASLTTALDINPFFSPVHAPAARAELDRLAAG